MTQAVDGTKMQFSLPSLEGDERILKESRTQDVVNSIARAGVKQEIAKQVVRKKLSKQRHLVMKEAIAPEYLDSLFPTLLELFKPQTVTVGCDGSPLFALLLREALTLILTPTAVQWRHCKH